MPTFSLNARAALVAASLFCPGAAWSQAARPSPCGDAVSVTRGDTLSRIAQRCDVSEAVLLAANPGVRDSGDLEVGTPLRLRRDPVLARSQLDQAADRLGAFASRAGEALQGVAGEVGSSVEELLNQNPNLQDRLRQLGIPGLDATATPTTLAIYPRQGPPGTSVNVSAIGLPANASVVIGGGPPRTAYEVLERARTTADGTLDVAVRVPGWAADAGSFVFVVAGGERRVRVRSDPFAVTSGAVPPVPLNRP